MLYVKRFILIDSAEDKSLWLYRAKRQWGMERPLAVRVKGKTETILGTTTPKDMVYNPAGKSWGIAWDETTLPPSTTRSRSLEAQEGVTSPAATPVTAEHTVTSVCASHKGSGNGTDALAHNASPPTASPAEDQVELVGINVSKSVTDGILTLEVIDLMGEVQCVSIVNLSSAFLSDSGQQYSILLTPNRAKSVDDTTVYGVLVITAMGVSPSEKDTNKAVKFLQNDRAPTPVTFSGLDFSTNTLHFPTCFLTGTGAYIVSNVIGVENRENKTITVELVVTGDSSVMRIIPSQVTLHQKNERSFFVCTWNVFRPFTISKGGLDGGAIKVRALISVDGEYVPPMEFHLCNEPPRPTERTQSYLLWVNTTMITNIPCSQDERALIEASLPVFAIK